MSNRFPARAARAAMGLCAAALVSATPSYADETWLQRAFERNEARTASASLSRERRAVRVASAPRVRHAQRRPQRAPKSAPAPLLAQLSSVPIVGSILSMVGLHEHRNRGQLRSRIGVDPARTPWCGFLMGWAVRQAGRTPPPGHGLHRLVTASPGRGQPTAVRSHSAAPRPVMSSSPEHDAVPTSPPSIRTAATVCASPAAIRAIASPSPASQPAASWRYADERQAGR